MGFGVKLCVDGLASHAQGFSVAVKQIMSVYNGRPGY